MGPVRTFLRNSKDAALAVAARSFVNARIRGIGELTELQIDTERQALQAVMQLAGESEPIRIHVRKYRIKRAGDGMTITLDDVRTSREWLTLALESFVVGRPFRVPPAAASALTALT